MQYIDKQQKMPVEIEKWVSKKTNKTEWDLGEKFYEGYKILREQLRAEQHGICCYCCQSLQEKAEIDHVLDRKKHPSKAYDYANLLLSCKTPNQCNNAKGHQPLDLTPLMTECDTEIKINLAGELLGNSDRANQAIKTLNLNNDKLCRKRQRKINDISFTFDPEQPDYPIAILDHETLDLMLQSFGRTPEYYEFQHLLKKLN